MINDINNDGSSCIGMAVYEICHPVKAGKIIALHSPRIMQKLWNGSMGYVTGAKFQVKWVKDGKITIKSEDHLKSYQKLLDDTQKKLNTHKKMIERINAL